METRNGFRVSGILTGPPSCPDLPVAGIGITATLLREGQTFQATADGQGRFELAGVPAGVLWLQSEAEHGGLFYYGDEMVAVDRDLSLTVVMSNPAVDLAVTPPLPETAAAPPGDLLPEEPPPGVQASAGLQEIAVRIQSKEKGVVLQEAKAFEVARGTRSVELKYTVASMEYEKWVEQGSPYDDAWSINVFAGQGPQQAKKIFQICRQVNDMQAGAGPVWKKAAKGGTTGEVVEKIDLPPAEGDAPWTVTLVAAAVNIEDARFPTAVKAALSLASAAQARIRVAAKAPANLNRRREPPDDTGVDSIPGRGETNEHERYFTIEVIEPAGGDIEHVEVRLVPNGAGEMTVADVAGSDLTIDPATRLPRVLVSMHGNRTSIYPSPPPAFDTFVYRFTVTAKKDGVLYRGEIDSGPRRALWHMPAGIPRFGPASNVGRDIGGDDWCTRATYEWLAAARDNGWLTAINDISGEHGTNLGHDTHRHGTDVDLFHFYLENNGSGGGAYDTLRGLVVRAARGDAARGDDDAQVEVELWIDHTRQGMDRLLEDPAVWTIYYAHGQAADGLPARWLSSLLREGSFTGYDTGLGPWENGDSFYLEWDTSTEHQSHLHIELRFDS